MRSVLSVLALGFAATLAPAGSPTLANVVPHGGQRGTTVPVVFVGQNLADAKEALTYRPGLAFTDFNSDKAGRVTAKVQIAADCPLGEHVVRVRTATGLSDARTFWVGALPEVAEKEPNNEFDKPQPIPLNCTVHGSIGNEDVDYFAVECKKGQRLSVEVEGQRLGAGFFDPYVAILNSKRFELATGDDSPMTGQDGGCSVVVPADGTYIVQIRESTYGSGNTYRLHVGTFPRPTAVIPAGGKPGEELEVRFLGDPTGEIKQKVKLPATADAAFRLRCETADGVHPAGFRFHVADLPNTIGGGATWAAATAGTAPGAFNGVVSKAGESTYFKFPAKKGQVFDLHCHARKLGSPLDPVLSVLNAQGGVMASNDDTGGPDSYLRFNVPADGEYGLAVRDHLNKGGPDYFFRIEAAPVHPETVLTLPRIDGNNPRNQDRQSLAIPKGNRFAVLVNVARKDSGGPLAVGFDGLPPGVTATVDTLDAGQAAVPVVLEATADAPMGGRLVAITATTPDPAKQPAVPSRTALELAYNVSNPGQTAYHKAELDRIAAAVTDAAPFTIEVIEPKAPVVQNGSLALKVVAKRADGFKGPITVQPLFTPPGMGIQTSATIPEGATETTLAMNATPAAAPRKWKTALIASGNPATGVVWVSSKLFAVEVAPAYVALAASRTAVEQGKDAQLFCKVTVAAPFEGKAQVKLLGLPPKTTAPDLELTKDATELNIPVKTDPTTPPGRHKLFCQVVITVNGEQVAQSTGNAELRVDVPLPPKPAAPAPAKPVAVAPKPAPAAKPPEPKRLTRLEQLRLEQEEREKAGQSTPSQGPKK